MTILFWTAGITFALAILTDAKTAITYATYVVGIRGVSFLCVKVTESVNKPMSDIINTSGWALAGVSCVKIIQLAMTGIGRIGAFFERINNFFEKLGI